MTMHLEGPWLSTTGKYKGKKKFRNAEEARKSRELDESWAELKKKHGIEEEKRRRNRALTAAPLRSNLSYSPRDTGPRIPSLNPADMGPATLAPQKVYTGDKILGIATMHKSNAVPVFSDDQAKDISKMRR